MKEFTRPRGDGFVWDRSNEQVWVTPWGKNAVRVRITREAEFRDEGVRLGHGCSRRLEAGLTGVRPGDEPMVGEDDTVHVAEITDHLGQREARAHPVHVRPARAEGPRGR